MKRKITIEFHDNGWVYADESELLSSSEVVGKLQRDELLQKIKDLLNSEPYRSAAEIHS